MKKISMFLIFVLTLIMTTSCNFGFLNSEETGNDDVNEENNDDTNTNKEETTNEINIIILCGQSNAEGHTWWIELQKRNPALCNKYLKREDSVIKMKYSCDDGRHVNDDYESVKLGMGFDSNRFGPEIGMNEALESVELTRQTYILKYTLGATDLYYQWKSYSSGGSAGRLYNGMIEFLYDELIALEDAGLKPYVKAVCWMQGEADSQDSKKTAAYGEYLNNFIEDLNCDLVDYIEDGDEKIKFVDAGISESSAWTNYLSINQQKAEVKDLDPLHRAYIDTVGMGLDFRKEPMSGPDLFHYDSLSMIELGKSFMEAILKFGVLK